MGGIASSGLCLSILQVALPHDSFACCDNREDIEAVNWGVTTTLDNQNPT